MGTWGPGNFENDTAGEILDEMVSGLVEHIEATVAEPSLMEPDEYDAVAMICNVEILASLAEGLGREDQRAGDCVSLPPPEQVRAWRDAYLAVWDATIDGLSPKPEHKKQRREVIVQTFRRLERCAANADAPRAPA